MKKFFGRLYRDRQATNSAPDKEGVKLVPDGLHPVLSGEVVDLNNPQTVDEWILSEVMRTGKPIIGNTNNEGRVEYFEGERQKRKES